VCLCVHGQGVSVCAWPGCVCVCLARVCLCVLGQGVSVCAWPGCVCVCLARVYLVVLGQGVSVCAWPRCIWLCLAKVCLCVLGQGVVIGILVCQIMHFSAVHFSIPTYSAYLPYMNVSTATPDATPSQHFVLHQSMAYVVQKRFRFEAAIRARVC
jgi:hypothetical protein